MKPSGNEDYYEDTIKNGVLSNYTRHGNAGPYYHSLTSGEPGRHITGLCDYRNRDQD